MMIRQNGAAERLALVACAWLVSVSAFANISGTVFQDYNDNGQMDLSLSPGTQAIDAGVGGVTITVFDSLGANVGTATSCGVTVAGVCTGSNPGFFDLAVAGTAPYRVEFTGLPAQFFPAAMGSGSGSNVQFVASANATNVNVGINLPPEYCQNDPDMLITTYTGGDPINGPNSNRACLLAFRYSAGNAQSALVTGAGGHDDSGFATTPVSVPASQLGATFGLGYHRGTRTALVASFMRSFAGFGPSGAPAGSTGAIYQVTVPTSGTAGTASVFVDLNTLAQFAADQPVAGVNPHPNNTADFTSNADEAVSGPFVGKRSLGDLDVSADDTTVYVVNANDRNLYKIPFNNPSAGTTRFAFPTQTTTSGGATLCNNAANIRPFALGERNGLIYVGAVCTAEGGTAADLRTIIYTFNPTTNTFSTDPVFSFPMNYARGCANGGPLWPASGSCGATSVAAWQPWQDNATNTPSVPQPLIGDIEFDGDNMVIAYRDRYADQSVGFIRSAGEVLRACFSGGSWSLETNGSCGGLTSAGANQGQGPGDGGTVPAGDGEYYFGDAYSQFHAELANGSLAQVPGLPDVVASVYDPVFSGANTTFDGGVRWLRNQLDDTLPGTITRSGIARAYRIYDDNGDFGPNDPFFGKSNGLGDIEAMCAPPPLQVGNRVWCDRNHNGVQDASAVEAGVNGVQVQLVCAGFNTVTTTTDASGNYLFGDAQFIAANPASSGLPRGAACTLRIDPAAAGNAGLMNAACGSTKPTLPNIGGGGGDLRDSDAIANGVLLDIPVTLGQSGQNSHDQDFGLGGSDLGDLPDTGAGVGANNYETLFANGGPAHPLVAGLRMGATVDAELDGQPNLAADGDDTALSPDDEDGITQASLVFVPGGTQNVQATVTNSTGSAARLCGFVDFNRDGDFADANESASVLVANGANNLLAILPFSTPIATTTGAVYARFRLSTDTAGACTANGAASDGEVEDYVGQVPPQDLGDLPDTAAGTGAGNYETLRANGGPVHPILAGLRLGASVDAEADGQPSASANGDDTNGAPDDEDGIDVSSLVFVPGIAQAVETTATNNSGSDARLCGFIDFNRDGDFGDAGETSSVTVPNGFTDLGLPLSFTAPIGTSSGSTYARFRLSTDTAGACAATGSASNGEVEDYVATVTPTDLGDLPDTGAGNGSANYNTLLADNGAAHGIDPALHLGAVVDAESDGQPGNNADGDDLNGGGDDEDGISVADLTLIAGAPAVIDAQATNNLGQAATLCGFIDFNGNGTLNDAGETAQVAVPAGSNDLPFVLDFGTVPTAAAANSYARFRLSTEPTCAPTGVVGNGEVEDYPVAVQGFDLGDLPDNAAGTSAGNYQTVLNDAGARHLIIANLRMGASVDPEADGQPSVGADSDDATGPLADDEDGVTFPASGYELGSLARVTVNATNGQGINATICGFIDWNGDGDFSDASEAATVTVPAGSNATNFQLNFGLTPLDAVPTTYGRFRIATDPGCAPFGNAGDGEVEDYVVTTTANGALSLGDLVFEDLDNDGVVDSGEPGIQAVPVSLYQDADQNCVPDGAAIDTTNTDVNGNYLFVDLVPGFYIVGIGTPTDYLPSTGSGLVWAPNGPYEPAPDPDNNTNSDDNGTAVGNEIRSCAVELIAKDEPTNDGDSDFNSNLSVDFGLVRNFDLALIKRLAPGQSNIVGVGQNVDFELTVYNQGSITASNIVLIDYIPVGLSLNDPDWTSVSAQTATILVPGPLAPGGSVVVPITLQVQPTAVGLGQLRNVAEIVEAQDPLGNVRPDKDSTPDNSRGNDGDPIDDTTDNTGGDEDDQDFASVGLIEEIPSLNLIGLLSLAFLVLAFGTLTTRRRA